MFCDFRESSLQKADEDEQGQETSRKRKRKEPGPCRENDVDDWVRKRQRLKARQEEEALKRKRTVFVGNLPISCTKKVELNQTRTLNSPDMNSLKLNPLPDFYLWL